MRKIISLIVAVIMLFGVIPSAYAYPGDDAFLDLGNAVTEEKEADVLCKLLTKLGLLSYETSNFIQTELADYSDFLYAIAAIENIDTSLEIGALYEELKARKLVPDEEMPVRLLLKDVAYSAVRLTGMWSLAEKKGGYPNGYLNVALEKKLLRNVRAENDMDLTKGELVQLLYNMLSIPSYVDAGVKNGNMLFEIGNPETLLERRFNVTMVEGIVTANGASSLYGRSEIKDTETEIDRTVYDNEGYSLRIHLGKKIVAFVTQSDEEPGKILCTELSKRNNVKSLNKGNAIDVVGNTISYTENGKMKSINAPKDAIVLYNGVSKGSVESVDLAEISKNCTEIEIIDNNGDKKADVVSIWKYQHFAVSAIGRNVVFLKYGMKFDGAGQIKIVNEEDSGYRVEAYKNGASISKTTEISVNDTISVAMSDNSYGEKLMIVQVSDKSITGKVSSIAYDEGGYVIGTAEGEFGQEQYYGVAHDFAEASGLSGKAANNPDIIKPTTGDTLVLCLTYDGYIADVRRTVTSENYGYIIKAGKTDGLDPEGKIKFIDAAGNVHFCNFADKVIYHDEDNLEGEKITGVECADNITSRSDSDYRTIIIYSLNNDGEVDEIYLPYDNRGNVPGKVPYPLTLDWEATESGEPSTYYFGFFDSYQYFAEQDNSLFVVPALEDAENEELYSVVSQAFYGTHYRFENIQLFGCDAFYQSKIGVTMAKVTKVPEIGNIPSMVLGIAYVRDEKTGDLVLSLKLSQDNIRRTLQVKDENLVSIGGFTEGTAITSLKKGDIIQYGTSMDGRIDKFRLMHRTSIANSYGKKTATEGNLHGTYAKVEDIKGAFMLGNISPSGTDASGTSMFRLGNPNAVRKFGASIYHTSTGDIEEAAATDVMIGDNVYLISNYGFITTMFIIRE